MAAFYSNLILTTANERVEFLLEVRAISATPPCRVHSNENPFVRLKVETLPLGENQLWNVQPIARKTDCHPLYLLR